MKTKSATAIALMLSFSLSAWSAPAGTIAVLSQPSDRVESTAGYASQIQPIEEHDPVLSARRQAALGGNVILWIGGKTDEVVRNFPALIAEAAQHANFTHVYLYDELFWNGDAFKIEIGLHEDLVLEGARIAHAAGLKTVVTILPDVILDPAFKLADINAFDGISIDVYPSIRISNDLHGCTVPGNLYEQLLACSAQKLRGMGFRGQIGYIYQAFGLHTETEAVLRQKLELQRVAIDNAAALGATAVMPWGLYLGLPEIAREPYLYALGGTALEYLVRP